MSWLFRYRLILFDFDGLLVDTERLHFAAYQKMCHDRGYALPWDFEQYCRIAHGSNEGLQKTIYSLFPGLQEMEPSWNLLYQEKKQAYETLLDGGGLQLMPGVAPLLLALEKEGKARCVVTNSFRSQVERVQFHLPVLKSIPLWITREDYALSKPSPDGYRRAISLLGEGSSEGVIGFEDSKKGVEALLAAGVEAVWVCQSHRCFPSHFGVRHLESLEGILGRPL